MNLGNDDRLVDMTVSDLRALLPRVPPDRRVFHTLQGLTGLRVGEVAGLRWQDYDAGAKPLKVMKYSQMREPFRGGRPRLRPDGWPYLRA